MPIMTFEFTREEAGNPLAAVKEDGSCWYYEYDELHQLTKAEWQDSGEVLYSYEYDYDKVGNRSSLIANGVTTTYTYDEANELTAESSPSQDAAYTYDSHGNQIARAVDGGDTTYYDCDARNNIASIWTRDAAFTPNYFNYDGDNVRTQIIDSTGVSNYTWDGLNIILERDDAGDLKRAYSHGHTPIDGAFSLLEEVEDHQGDRYAYHMDQAGGVKSLTDEDQATAQSLEHCPFGRALVETGAAPNPFGFPATYVQLPGLPGLGLSPVRCYTTGPSRFLSRDRLPYEAAASPYVYAANLPLGVVDPTGLCGQNASDHAGADGDHLYAAASPSAAAGPASPVQALKFAEVEDVTLGNCGKFKWRIKWKLARKRPRKPGGWIVQRVQWDYNVLDCSNQSIVPRDNNDFPSGWHYFEVWRVMQKRGLIEGDGWDTFRWWAPGPNVYGGRCTKGVVLVNAVAWYHDGVSKRALTSDFSYRSAAHPWPGNLRARRGGGPPPLGGAVTPSRNHLLHVGWNCCIPTGGHDPWKTKIVQRAPHHADP